jgi:penicillin amidase
MDEYDLFFAQGFVMARERLFQMSFLRRFAAGRLSEVAGEGTLEIDRWQRVVGLRRSAEKAWPHASEEAKTALLAFSAGVNAALDNMLADNSLPYEFRLLGTVPERWTPVDSLSIMRLIALSLSVGWESDLLREGLRSLLGEEMAQQAVPLPPLSLPSIDAPGLAQVREIAASVGAGSNAWVVDGSRTETGLPLLANDPHLALGLPSIWFVQHLDCPTLKVAGCTIVGLPGVILGHNEHGAWALTNACADVQDLYIEQRIKSDEPHAVPTFQWGDMRLPATLLEERISVKGYSLPARQPVVITRHGPLISDLLPHETRDLALRWTIDEPDDSITAILRINRAQNWHQFRDALANFGAPPLNFSWADKSGAIGWSQAGHIPLRQGELGIMPVDGSTGENEWLGYIAVEELPQLSNPAAGYIVHANNRPVGEDYPHWLGVDFFPGYRAARLSELLEARATHNAESFRAMQTDSYSYPEHRLAQVTSSALKHTLKTPYLLTPLLVKALTYLAEWDGHMEIDSVGATIAHTLFHQVRHLLVSEHIGPLWAAVWQGKQQQPEQVNLQPSAFNSWAWLIERLDEPNHPWWSMKEKQSSSRDDLLMLALERTVAQLRQQWGDDPSQWRWGTVHQRTIEHPLGRIPVIGKLFNRGPYPMSGSAFSITPDLSTVQPDVAYQVSFQSLPLISASVRLIADLSDWDNYLLALPGGNSGHPASPHYADGLEAWRKGELEPFAWSRQAVEEAKKGRLLLLPA